MHQPNIIEVPPCDPLPLEAARRELERLEGLAADVRNEGTETEYLNCIHFVAIARAEVARLERLALQTAKAP